MALLAYNLTSDPVTLAAGAVTVTLPPSPNAPAPGPAVNVTSKLADLSNEEYTALAQQATDTVQYVWTTVQEYTIGNVPAAAQANRGNVIVWAPYYEPGDGYYTDWADAVAAAQMVSGPKTIQILANPDSDNVYIPGGTWDMSGVTLTGLAVGVDTDTNNRGAQELLFVTGLGRLGRYSFNDNCAGAILDVTEGVVTFSVDGFWFQGSKKYVEGQYIQITNAASGVNNGTFLITEVVDDNTIKFVNADATADEDHNWNLDWFIDNPVWLKNLAGMKDLYFRASDDDMPVAHGLTGSVADTDGNWTLFTKTGGYAFSERDIGKPIRIGAVEPYQDAGPCDNGNNNGTYVIYEVVDKDTIVYWNDNSPSVDANNGSIEWGLCTSTVIFNSANPYYPYPQSLQSDFHLDNVDFRYGGDYDWGSLYVLYSSDGSYQSGAFIHLLNGASIRWYSCIVDNDIVIQSDGSPCWLGNYALSGNGTANIYAMGGMEVHGSQDIDTWNLHQSYTVYLPSNGGNWDGIPMTVAEALDRLAAACTAAGHQP